MKKPWIRYSILEVQRTKVKVYQKEVVQETGNLGVLKTKKTKIIFR